MAYRYASFTSGGAVAGLREARTKNPGSRSVQAPMLKRPSLKWRWRADGVLRSPPVVGGDGTVYLACMDGHVYALDPTGELLWSAGVRGMHGVSHLALGRDALFLTMLNGEHSCLVC